MKANPNLLLLLLLLLFIIILTLTRKCYKPKKIKIHGPVGSESAPAALNLGRTWSSIPPSCVFVISCLSPKLEGNTLQNLGLLTLHSTAGAPPAPQNHISRAALVLRLIWNPKKFPRAAKIQGILAQEQLCPWEALRAGSAAKTMELCCSHPLLGQQDQGHPWSCLTMDSLSSRLRWSFLSPPHSMDHPSGILPPLSSQIIISA